MTGGAVTGRPVTDDRDPRWRDRLVDLHVLAANGDIDAATTAWRWLARDPEARRAWIAVERACDQVQAGR